MIRRPPRSTQSRSSAASDVYKSNGMYIISVFHKRHYLLELADIVIYCFYTVVGFACNLCIFTSFYPFSDNQGTVRERASHILNSGTERDKDVLLPQIF